MRVGFKLKNRVYGGFGYGLFNWVVMENLWWELSLVWVIVSLVGEFMVELMFTWVRENLVELESITCIDWMNWLWFGVWMLIFIGLGSQALEGDRGK